MGLQAFLSNDHIIYFTTVREPDISRNVIVSGYVTFYRINKSFAKYCFLLMTKCFRGPDGMAPWAGFGLWVVV